MAMFMLSTAKLNRICGLRWFNMSVISKTRGACYDFVGCVK